MIQRLQTIYLLLAIGLLIALIFAPIATVDLFNGGTAVVDTLKIAPFIGGEADGQTLLEVCKTQYLSILVAIATVISIFALTRFKNLELQIRLCSINMVILLGAQIFVGYSLYNATKFIETMNQTVAGYATGVDYSIVAVFPAIAMIFTFLALRGATKDMLLLQSLDRIR